MPKIFKTLEYKRSKCCSHSILLINFPHQLLHGLSAINYDQKKLELHKKSSVILFLWSYNFLDHKKGSLVSLFITRLLMAFDWIVLYVPSITTRLIQLSPYRKINAKAEWIRRTLGHKEYDRIYYSHDVSKDHTSQAFFQAFPNAKRICFGDPPGYLYSHRYKGKQAHSFLAFLKRRFWVSRHKKEKKFLYADKNIISINMNKKIKKNISIIPTKILLSNLVKINNAIKKFYKTDLNKLQRLINKKYVLFLAGNFSQSKLMSKSDEINFYKTICVSHVQKNKCIILKQHPGSNSDFLLKLRNQLNSWKTIVLPNSLNLFPIEFLPKLVKGSHKIISVSSSSFLLDKIYNKKVIHVSKK